MKEYLLSLFGVCMVSAIVRVAAPEGSAKKYVEILCSLCVAAAMILPAFEWISSADGVDGLLEGVEYETQDYGAIYDAYILESNVESAEAWLEKELCEHFQKDADSFAVELEVTQLDTEITVTSARVTLNHKTLSVSPEEIKDFIYERIECECEIIYSLNDK